MNTPLRRILQFVKISKDVYLVKRIYILQSAFTLYQILKTLCSVKLCSTKLYGLILCLCVSFSASANPSYNAFKVKVLMDSIIEHEYEEFLVEYAKRNQFQSVTDILRLSDLTSEAQKLLFFLYLNENYKTSISLVNVNNEPLSLNPVEREMIEQLIKKTNTPEALFIRGFYSINYVDHKAGLDYLQQAKDGGHPLAYIVLAYYAMFRTEQLLEYAENKKELWNEGVRGAYKLLVDMEQRNVRLWGFDMLMGLVLYELEQYQQATERFKLAIHKEQFKGNAYANIGIIHEDVGREEHLAKERYTQAVKEGVSFIKPRLARLYLIRREYKPALELLEEMANHWGKYSDGTSIKSTFWLSYIFGGNTLRTYQDLQQAYVWARIGVKMYVLRDISSEAEWNKQTEAYILPYTQAKKQELRIIKPQELVDVSFWPEEVMNLKIPEEVKPEHIHVIANTMRTLEKRMPSSDIEKAEARAEQIFDFLYGPGNKQSCQGKFTH